MSEPFKVITQKESWAQEVQQDVVVRLRSLLEQAESGDIQGFAFVGVCLDGTVLTCATKNDDQCKIIGGMERMKFRMLKSED